MLKKEIKKLNKKLEKMKTQILIETENTDNQKQVKPIEDKLEDVDKVALVKKELELNKTLFETGERLNFVHLSYRKLIDNINHLKAYHDNHPIKEMEEYKKRNEENYNQTTNLTEENQKKEEKKEENDGIMKANEEKEEKDNNGIIKLNIEEEKFISDYEQFLKESSKTIDILFLMHSKLEFLEIMKQKGEEQKKLSNQKRNTYSKSARVIRKVTKRKTRTILSSLSRKKEPVRRFSIKQRVETSKKKNIDDDLISKDEDKDIMKRFIEEHKRERANFLKVRSWVKK